MKRVFLSILLTLVSTSILFAGDNSRPELREEKIVTAKGSALIGVGYVANHFLSEYEYEGSLVGIDAEFGAFYKRSENLSWDLDLSIVTTMNMHGDYSFSLSNPAKTNYWMLKNYSVQYGTSYNWNPAKNLYLKAGGAFNFLFGTNTCKPDNINNSADFDIQPQLKASAGIKYGWTFNKLALYLYGDLEVPVLGGALVSSKYQSSSASISNDISKGDKNVFILTSFHNMQGFNSEIGIDFSFDKCSIFISADIYNRWWNSYDIQNYRKYRMLKIGVAVDLVSRPHAKCNSRYF